MFDIIIGLYVQYINGGQIYIYVHKSHHEIVHDKNILEIFPNLSSKIITINDLSKIYDIKNKTPKNKRTTINCENIDSLDDFIVDDKYKLIWITRKSLCYKHMYHMCEIIKLRHNNIFNINTNIISKKILKITKTDYMIIHIRYGDKLKLAFSGDNSWIIYAPSYYQKIIQEYAKKIKIYIITDDVEIVNHFILNDIVHHNVKLLDVPWWDAFYCLVKSKYTILNISTFSMLGSLLNDKLIKGIIVTRSTNPNLLDNNKIPEEDIIPKTNWITIDNDEHILNFDEKLMKKMLEFKKNL